MNQNIIRIINEGAKELDATVIAMFQINNTGDKYSIYTFNEEDAQGLVKIYASRMVEVAGLYSFVSIANADEWGKIKDIMKYMAKADDEDGTNGGTIKLIPISEIKKQMKEPISVNLSETKAAKIGPNYKSGIINCYNKNAKSAPVEQPKINQKVTEMPSMDIPSFEIPKQDTAKIEIPKVENVTNTVPSVEPIIPKIEEVKKNTVIDNSNKNEDLDKRPTPMDIPAFEMPKIEEKKEEPFSVPKIDNLDENKAEDIVPKFETRKNKKEEKEDEEEFEVPKIDEDEDNNLKYDTTPNVDSILNKASYYQNIKEEEKPANDNIIQTIGLEFMKKVSELAEYEKELNRKNRDLEARERILTKLEKEISSKEERQKNLNQSNKKKEIELKKYEKELDDRDSDLNRRIIEFNKKISMFQQTFETISKVD